MIRRDVETLLKAMFAVAGTVLTLQMILDLPASVYVNSRVLGELLLTTVFVVFFISIDGLLSPRWSFQLLPQSQLALWTAGLGAILMGTDGWRHLEPTSGYWVMAFVVLTLICRDGWRWLAHMLKPPMTSGQ
jgi:hypothetical protein